MMEYKKTNLLVFVGNFRDLKHMGFHSERLYNNNNFYTTYETGRKSDIWIQQSMRLVKFDGFNNTSSSNAIRYLIENNFVYPPVGLMEDETTCNVKEFNWSEYQSNRETHRWIFLKYGTVELLKKMHDAGMLSFKEFEVN